jgi:hypothetical protein
MLSHEVMYISLANIIPPLGQYPSGYFQSLNFQGHGSLENLSLGEWTFESHIAENNSFTRKVSPVL